MNFPEKKFLLFIQDWKMVGVFSVQRRNIARSAIF